MSASLIDKIGGATIVNGYLQYSLTYIYQVIAPRTSGINTILQWPGIPQAGSVALIEGQTVWVDSPTCRLENPRADKWIVTVPYTNQTSQYERDYQGNPVTDPVDAVKQVTIDWADIEEPVNNARFRGITTTAPEQEGGTPVTLTPTYMKDGPVTNSAGVPIEVMRRKRIKIITVRRVARNWESTWEDYQNAVNTDKVTIIESDKDGERARHVFEKFTLKLAISTPNEWKNGFLYYRPAFVMEHNPKTWIHSEVDRGRKRRAQIGYYKPEDKDGRTTYNEDDLKFLNIYGTNDYWESITTNNGKVAIGDPVLFGGYGCESTIDPANKLPTFTNWDVETNLKAFGPLNL